MIVDDHPRMRKLIRDLCAGAADEFIEFACGEDAVTAYDRLHPDCVLMDIEMPGMNGLTATRAIRSSDPTARIIITTSHDTPSFRQQAMLVGANAFVSKDDLSNLPQLIQERCPQGRASGEGQETTQGSP